MNDKHRSIVGNIATAFILALSLPVAALEDAQFLGNLARTDGDPQGTSAWAERVAVADDAGVSLDVFLEWGLAKLADE